MQKARRGLFVCNVDQLGLHDFAAGGAVLDVLAATGGFGGALFGGGHPTTTSCFGHKERLMKDYVVNIA